jgi:hypothetical protein
MVGAADGDPCGDRVLGAVLFGLVSDWDSWVRRRVDTFHFAGDDERVLRRHQSVDLWLPPSLTALDPALVDQLGGYPTPLTFVSKWQLPEFSLRDRTDVAVSLVQRDGAVQLGGGMLVALGTFTLSNETEVVAQIDSKQAMPEKLEAELHEIAAAGADTGVRLCVDFQQLDLNREGDSEREHLWRSRLARDETFMSLAYELAVSFPLVALIPPTRNVTSHLLKFSYNSYVVPAERDRLSVRFDHCRRWLRNHSRDGIDPIEWDHMSSLRRYGHTPPDSSTTGRLVLSSSSVRGSERLRQRASSIASGIVTIDGAGGRRVVRLRPSGLISISGMPVGTYTIGIEGASGFWHEPDGFTFEIQSGGTKRLHVRATRERFTQPRTLAPPIIAAAAWWPKRAWRGCGWGSKPLAIRIRLGDGGEYRCEFRAPAGLHVTRAKLVSNLDGNEEGLGETTPGGVGERHVHTVLESKQESYLECPGQPLPSAAYVLLNLRPRRETIVRPALFTALLTLGIVGGLAIGWSGSDGFGHHQQGGLLSSFFGRLSGGNEASDPPWGLLAVLLGGPSALAAYFAQAVPSRVTNAMLYGIRLTALLPVVLSLATAAILLTSPSGNTDASLALITALAAVVATSLGFTYFFAEYPPEQSVRRQGGDFESVHLENPTEPPGGGGGIEPSQAPEVIRDRMLERIGGMTGATRRAVLGQRWFSRWEREAPPALYFDSAEPPAVFQGLPNQEKTRKMVALTWDAVDKSWRGGDGPCERSHEAEKAAARLRRTRTNQ